MNQPINDEALRWFVRSRAGDFPRMSDSGVTPGWRPTSPTKPPMMRWAPPGTSSTTSPPCCPGRCAPFPRPAPLRPAVSPWRLPRLLPFGGAVAAAAVLAFVFLMPREEILRSIEARPGQHRQLVFADGTQLSLDAGSAARVSDTLPPRIELLKGRSIWTSAKPAPGGSKCVQAPRASATSAPVSPSACVTGRATSPLPRASRDQDGQNLLMLFARRGADFGPQGIAGERPIAEADIAPWRNGQWHFTATPLAELADELARQQGIRLDLPDPKVAALTVSGSFPISEPDRVLWAVAQVHGLKLDRLDERHCRLRKG